MAVQPVDLEKPFSSPPGTPETVIHVIPKEFYGAAVPARRPVQDTPAAAPPPAPSVPAKGKHGILTAAIVIMVVLVLGVAAASYYLLVVRKSAPSAAPAAVCGDSACNGTETYATCPADCPAPAPVCGDNSCNGTETNATCAADCPASAAVCGDSACNGTETYATCPADCPAPAPVCGDGKCEEGKEDTTTCPGDCRPPTPVAGQDLDSDGLTDLEEVQIYDTDTRNADSDGDSYVDLNELVNLYNPAKPLPSMLKDNRGITTYENNQQKYSLFRPTSWSVRDGDEVGSEVYFEAPDGEYVEVLVQPKPEDQTLMAWYLGQAPGVKETEVTSLKTRSGHQAIQSPDKLSSYIDVGNRVVVLTYGLGKDNLMQYRATFLMMAQSLKAERVQTPVLPAKKSQEESVPALVTEPATVAGTPATAAGGSR